MIELKTKLSGMYKMEAVNQKGEKRLLADWFPNLILNQGLDLIAASAGWLVRCSVGSSSTAPAVTDTSLGTLVAGTNTVLSDNTGFSQEVDADSAYTESVTPAATTGTAINFTLGSGNWDAGDISKTIFNRSSGEAGIAIIRSVSGSVAVCDITTNFTNTDAIASGDWEMYAVYPYKWYTLIYSFGVGVAAGNLSEVGVGTSTPALFSRALILNSVGSPTSITVLSDEVLYVTYSIRRYQPIVDTSSVLTLRSTSHTFTGRAALITSVGWGLPWNANIIQSCNVYDGVIGQMITQPSGNSSILTVSTGVSTYANGNYYLDYTFPFSVTQGNLTNFISAIHLRFGGAYLQFGVTPAIEKTADDILSLTFRLSWGRR